MEQGFQSTDKQEDLQENDEEEDIQSKNKQEDPLAMSKEELWGLFEQRLRAKNLRFEDIRGASDRKEVLKVLGFTNSISLARLETIWEEQKQKPVTKQVRISGEVTNPGTYDVPVNATWGDLVRRAGGFTETGDDLFLESSHRLDRDHYIVPALPWLERALKSLYLSVASGLVATAGSVAGFWPMSQVGAALSVAAQVLGFPGAAILLLRRIQFRHRRHIFTGHQV
eukprot:TRINITY_DN4725_c0_g1_i2.p1 TRINITY_DN4725_c0_g1~~TRINITY_DN4725_c0_g1_i2.p1  ORF type:complete len:226 (+),score=28.31 TRINITY_DN4725_c0_g1_i2:76-753(+)